MGPSAKRPAPDNKLLLALVGVNIALQLTSASLIKYAAGLGHARMWALLVVMSIVMALSLGRFAAWHAMHQRFPVSVAYPATALFFPCLVSLAWFLGEPVSLRQALGAVLVTIGVLMLIRSDSEQEEITA
jgi:drug/metabolite transporter (DMT)-like permease